MLRSLTVAAVAAAAFAFAPASALACDGHPECGADCPMNKTAKGEHKHKKSDKTTAKAADKKADEKKVTAPAEAEPAAKPAEQTSIMDEIDQILAAKCDCSGQGDCTCKKGECKCAKCGGHSRVRMIESLRGADSTTLPSNARYDATAGVFI